MNKKISELNDLTLPINGDELLAIVQGGETKKVSANNLLNAGDNNLNLNSKGVIYNKDSWDNLDEFETFGGANLSLSNNKIIISTNTLGYGNYITFTAPTGLNKWKQTIEFKILNPPDANSFGLGLGIQSANLISNNGFSILMRGGFDTNPANEGVILLDYGSPTYSNIASQSAQTITFQQNDIIRMTFEQDLDVLKVTKFNLTDKSINSLSYTYNVSSTVYPSNTGDFNVAILGGQYEIQSIKVETKTYKDSKVMFVGDSKTNGFIADSFKESFAQQAAKLFINSTDNSGGNDTTNEVLLKLNEILDLKPKMVVLNIGSNDKRYGYNFTEWSGNYDSIVTQLENQGITVLHLLQLNENVLDFTDYNNYIKANYTKIIDAGIVPLVADGVHPSQDGHDQIFYTVVSEIEKY